MEKELNNTIETSQKLPIKFIFIHSDGYIYGHGNTYEDCIENCRGYMLDDDGDALTTEEIEDLVSVPSARQGDYFNVLAQGDAGFENLMEKIGCYEKINGEWFLINN